MKKLFPKKKQLGISLKQYTSNERTTHKAHKDVITINKMSDLSGVSKKNSLVIDNE